MLSMLMTKKNKKEMTQTYTDTKEETNRRWVGFLEPSQEFLDIGRFPIQMRKRRNAEENE